MAATVTKKTYQQRNTLAAQPFGALTPIPALPVTPFKPFLAALEASTMGVLGTPKDGFDALLAPLVAALPAHDTQVAALDAAIKAASFTPGAIVKTVYNPIGANITALAKVGDAQLASINGDLTNGTTTPPPGGGGGNPPHGGGGGGAGGGGANQEPGEPTLPLPGGITSGPPHSDPRFQTLEAVVHFVAPSRAALTAGKGAK